jgi:hypothetical protein
MLINISEIMIKNKEWNKESSSFLHQNNFKIALLISFSKLNNQILIKTCLIYFLKTFKDFDNLIFLMN